MKPGETYQWTATDKGLYALSMFPFAVLILGAAYLLFKASILLAAGLATLYVLVNVFQAGCCVGCPYRGRYCPALGGVYLGNFLSGVLYKNREFDQAFFNRNAKRAEILVLVLIFFPLYWVYAAGWYLVPVYFALLALHVFLFMPTQCEKCGYNTTCPGGRAWRRCRGLS